MTDDAAAEAAEALDHLDDAIRAYTKLITRNEDTICTAWVLTMAALHPDRGEQIATDVMPGQTYVTTRGLMSVAERYWRGKQA